MRAFQRARMACDAARLVDEDAAPGSPKLDELEALLDDLCVQQGEKVVVFSEWEKMQAPAAAGWQAAAGSRSPARRRPVGEARRADRSLPRGPGLQGVPLDRRRRCRSEPPSCPARDQPGPAVEPGQARAANRARLAQGADARGDGRQPRRGGHDRARDGASARRQAGAGRWRAGWRRAISQR